MQSVSILSVHRSNCKPVVLPVHRIKKFGLLRSGPPESNIALSLTELFGLHNIDNIFAVEY